MGFEKMAVLFEMPLHQATVLAFYIAGILITRYCTSLLRDDNFMVLACDGIWYVVYCVFNDFIFVSLIL